MRNLTEIKHRIKSVSETHQITGAMETISVAKMRKAMERFEKNKFYFEKLRETISNIVLHTNSFKHRFIGKANGDRAVFIVIASDKGLAGAFNNNILKYAYAKMQEYTDFSVFTIGEVAREYFLKKGVKTDIEFSGSAYDPTMRDASEISETIVRLFSQNMMDKVFIIYTKMLSNHTMHPDIISLLPLSDSEVIKDTPLTAMEELYLHEIEYEPSPEAVLESLVPQYLTGIIYGALVQSCASEHSARRAAMSNATKNANEILNELKIEYNRARQESVTGEITEIITSSMGVRLN